MKATQPRRATTAPGAQGSLPLPQPPRRVTALQPYLRACRKLREAEADQFAAAFKVHAVSYSRTTPIYCRLPFSVANGASSNEFGYWDNLDALVAACDEEDVPIPPYVWATKPSPRHLDAAEILEAADQDVDATAVQELQALLDVWGRKHPDIEVDYSRAILLAESADPAHDAQGRAV